MRAQHIRASGGDKIKHLLDYKAKLCLKRLADPMGELRREGKKATKHSGPPVTETAAGYGHGWSCVLNYRQLLVGSLLALMQSHVSKGNLIPKERSSTGSFNPVPTLLGPNPSTVHSYS